VGTQDGANVMRIQGEEGLQIGNVCVHSLNMKGLFLGKWPMANDLRYNHWWYSGSTRHSMWPAMLIRNAKSFLQGNVPLTFRVHAKKHPPLP